MLNIDIVIVNFNSGRYIGECLESLDTYCSDIISSIIVVDNNSSDSSFIEVEKKYSSEKKIRMLGLSRNIGFGAACNHGASFSNSEFILFLNPDTFLVDDIFKILSSHSPELLKKQITGANLCDISGTNSVSAANFPDFLMLLVKAFGLHKLFSAWDGQLLKGGAEGDSSFVKVDVVSGAFFFISREVFMKLNGFDTLFFVYYEEVDLSYRAKKILNVNSFIDQRLTVGHVGGGCTSSSLFALSLNISSKLLYSKKHFSYGQHYVFCFVVLSFEIPLRIVMNLNRGKEIYPLIKLFFGLDKYVK